MHDQRSAAAGVLRELWILLEYKRAELAALERAAGILQRDADEHDDRCDRYHPDHPCAGEIHARHCRICGDVVKRCQSTAASAPQAMLPISIGQKHRADSMLALPRPTTRADCGAGSATVSLGRCRHHLMLEVAESKGTKRRTPSGRPRDERPTSLRMN